MARRKATGKPRNKVAKGAKAPSARGPVQLEGALAMMFGGGARAKRSPEKVALEEAQQLVYSAWETDDGARRVAIAKRALEISRDCVDAYVVLALHAGDLGEATRLNELAVEAGARALGAEAFTRDVGHFWGLLETRPYMRARLALAQCAWEAGKREEAIGHYREMLRLNPGDNQGVRYLLAACLLDLERDDELVALIEAYKDEATAAWAWTSALLAFRKRGDDEHARRLRAEAKKTNPHVPAYLSGRKKMPRRLPDMIGFGDESEAISYVGDYASGWKRTPRAIEWASR